MFLKLIVYSKNEMTIMKKKEYIDKLFSSENGNVFKKGVLTKFNNAVGFKDVSETLETGHIIIPAKIQSPKDYKTPETLLLEGLFVSLKDNEIMSFEVEDKKDTRKIQEFFRKNLC